MKTIESAVILENTKLWQTAGGVLADRLREGKPIRIMGPCALQATEQMLAIVAIIRNYIELVRAPHKKPRTRPFNTKGELLFAGIDEEQARLIFQEVITKYPGLLFAIEAMSGADVLAMAQHIGLAWNGSRTTTQETSRDIGKGAHLAQVPVLVKNAMPGDIEATIGMVENVILGGEFAVPTLLCLRGTFPETHEQAAWRNTPNIHWLQPIKKAFPDLPVLIDPSHMLRKENLTPQAVVGLVQQALDEGADGYIIEVNVPEHPSKTDPGVDAQALLNVLVQKNAV